MAATRREITNIFQMGKEAEQKQLYETLGLPRGANIDQIRQQFD